MVVSPLCHNGWAAKSTERKVTHSSLHLTKWELWFMLILPGSFSASVWWYSKRREILGKKVIHILASHFRVTSEHFSAGQYWPNDLSQYYFHATLTDTLITKAMPATRLCPQGTRFAFVWSSLMSKSFNSIKPDTTMCSAY